MGKIITFNYSGTEQQFKQYASRVGNVSKALSKHIDAMRMSGDTSSRRLIELQEELEQKKNQCSQILATVQDIENQISMLELKQKEKDDLRVKFDIAKADYISDMKKDYDLIELKLKAQKSGYETVDEFLSSEFDKTKEVKA